MAKKSRRLRIISLINEFEINTQEELVKLLNNEGYNTTQATVSRDIKILGLQKVKGVTKNFKYALPPESEKTAVTEDKVITLLKTFIISMIILNLIRLYLTVKTDVICSLIDLKIYHLMN